MKTLLLSSLLNRVFFVVILLASLNGLVACQPDTVEPEAKQMPELVHINHDTTPPAPSTPITLPQAPAPPVGTVMTPR